MPKFEVNLTIAASKKRAKTDEKFTKILRYFRKKILVLDGAMGTMIQRYNFSEEDFRGSRFRGLQTSFKGNNDLLITQPKAIKEIRIISKPVQILLKQHFSSNSVAMADYHMEDLVYELNLNQLKSQLRLAKNSRI